MLTGPMFMMLVYNKVLTSKSLPTLSALSLLVLVLYIFYGLLECPRGKVMARMGTAFDTRLAPRLAKRLSSSAKSVHCCFLRSALP